MAQADFLPALRFRVLTPLFDPLVRMTTPERSFSNDLPFDEASFDVVVSTLFFHHLTSDVKMATLREVARVLAPGGRLHIGDWGSRATR